MKTSKNILYFLAGVSGHEAPSFILAQPSVGGLRFNARIWELKKRGLEFSWRFKETAGKKSHTTIYRLETPLTSIDFDNCSVKL